MALNLYEMNPQIYDEYVSTELEKINSYKVFELVKNITDKKDSIEIIDFCCGTGIFPRTLLSKLNNVKYLGLDINKNFINFAQEKLKDERFNFVYGNSVNFKIDRKFDIALATSSYHHIEDTEKINFLKNICSCLKEDGVLVIYEKFIESFSNKVEAIDSAEKFYLERIKYMINTEELSENQLFALFNEQYLSAIRHEEYKVDLQRFKNDIENSGLKIKEQHKLWPKENLYHNDEVGDFIFLVVKK